jgi:hypothetical protein
VYRPWTWCCRYLAKSKIIQRQKGPFRPLCFFLRNNKESNQLSLIGFNKYFYARNPFTNTNGVPASADPLIRSARLAIKSSALRGVVPSVSKQSAAKVSPFFASMEFSISSISILHHIIHRPYILYFNP